MGSIVLLDELTINKIAAGEVIERPASVVKELVENSIDAGATAISVEIKNGGISYIKVIDNGKGIGKDDLEIAFERHATSKIRTAEDIIQVKSMGFRGEALASVAAIAKVELISKTEQADIGNKIVVEGGNILSVEEVACQKGTMITIDNLFYNTPVRYKFLKKDFTEGGYIEDIIVRLALINTEIAFKLISNGKTIIQTSGDGNIKNVIYGIYGKDVAEAILDVNYEYEGMKMTGVVGKPEISRSNRTNQLFFVNGRYIKDNTLSAAISQAFKGLIPIGKFGFVILNLEMSTQKVDVNVHPAKLEVRFEEENNVFQAAYHAVKESLLKMSYIEMPGTETKKMDTTNSFLKPKEIMEEEFHTSKQTQIQTAQPGSVSPETNNIIEQLFHIKNKLKEQINEEEVKLEEKVENEIENKEEFKFDHILKYDENKDEASQANEITEEIEEENNLKEEMGETKKFSVPTEEQIEKATQELSIHYKESDDIKSKVNTIINEAKKEYNASNFDEMYVKTFGKKMSDSEIPDEELLETELKNKNYKYIGVAFLTYIIIEVKEDLYFIDQHAAHERILYEKVKSNFYSTAEKDAQLMLIPDVINLTHKEMDIVKDHEDLFIKAGFVIEEFGDNSVKLMGVPTVCIELDTKEMFLEILDEIDSVARTSKQEIEEKLIATIACKAAVKANMKLNKQEVESLIEQLLKLNNPFTCPHGRPTAIRMKEYELERKFNRK